MNEIDWLFILYLSFFLFFLVFKSLAKLRFCVICLSHSFTWITLLIFYFFGIFTDLLPIAVLMGGSAVGLYTLAEKKSFESLHLFRLPFLLSLLVGIFAILGRINELVLPLLFLSVLWGFFVGAYFFRNQKGFKNLVEKLIACCRDW